MGNPTQANLRTTQGSHRTIEDSPGTHGGPGKLKTPPPAFVKVNKKQPQEEQKRARKKRGMLATVDYDLQVTPTDKIEAPSAVERSPSVVPGVLLLQRQLQVFSLVHVKYPEVLTEEPSQNHTTLLHSPLILKKSFTSG